MRIRFGEEGLKMKKKIKKERKVTAKDLDEWAKRGTKDLILHGKTITHSSGDKLTYISPDEFEGVEE
jgi:hypothetical protein